VGHHWPVDYGVVDVITNKSVTVSINTSFLALVDDRFGESYGAIRLDSALMLPNDIYFHGNTTVTMWLYKHMCGGNSNRPLHHATLCRITKLLFLK
jgi:hypothetical protein